MTQNLIGLQPRILTDEIDTIDQDGTLYIGTERADLIEIGRNTHVVDFRSRIYQRGVELPTSIYYAVNNTTTPNVPVGMVAGGGFIIYASLTGAGTLKFPEPSDIETLFPMGALGTTWSNNAAILMSGGAIIRIYNQSAFNLNFAGASANVQLRGTAGATLATGNCRTLMVQFAKPGATTFCRVERLGADYTV